MEIVEKLERAGLDERLVDQIYALVAERLTDIGKKIAKRKKDECEYALDGQMAQLEKQLPEDFLAKLAYSQSHECELFYWHGVEDGVMVARALLHFDKV